MLTGRGFTGITVLELEAGMMDAHAEGLTNEMIHNGLVLPTKLVTAQNSIELTVGPVDGVLKDCEGVGMEEVVTSGKDLTTVIPVVVRKVNVVQLRVRKVNPTVRNVERNLGRAEI